MKLKNLTIKNFQGIKNISFDFQGKNSNIYGTNAAGKTTVANAFTWLLFDRSYNDIKGFSPKPQGETGEGLHNIETVVVAEIITDNERVIKLSKEFKETWKSKRGSVTKEFTGHSIEYFIDDVPTSAGDYNKFIESIIEKDKARILTTPLYFAEIMSWQERRKLLMETFGGVTNDDVFNNNKELLVLKDEMGNLEVDEFIKKEKNVLSKAIKEIEESKVRIDELKTIEKPGDDINILEKEKAEIFIKLEEVQQQKAKVEAGSVNTTAIDKKILETIAELQGAQEKHIKEQETYVNNYTKAKNLKQEKVDLIKKELRQAESKQEEIQESISKIEKTIAEKSKEREKELAELNKLDNTVFDEASTICPCCNRPLEADKIAEMKANFNNKLADDIKAKEDYIRSNCSKSIIQQLEKEKEEHTTTLNKLADEINNIKIKLEQVENEKVVVEEPSAWWSNTINKIQQELADLKAERQNMITAGSTDVTQFNNTIISLKNEMEVIQNKISKINAYKNTESRIKELHEIQKNNIKIRENAEGNIDLADEFIRVKMEMLSNNINNQFDNVKFKMFDTQINGGIKEICEVLVPDGQGNNIAFSVANNSGRINACIEIINFLSDKWGVRLPLFIDNAESIVKLANTETQIIQLIVSEEDKTLRLV